MSHKKRFEKVEDLANKYWILDEPMTGLDPKVSYILKDLKLLLRK